MNLEVRKAMKEAWDDILDHEYELVEEMRRNCPGPCRYVELGCGSLGLLGRVKDRLSDLYPGSVGIDLDPEELAQNKNVMHRVCGDCYSLPLESESVGILVSRWVFEHLADPDKALSECARVLKRGGSLYIKTSNLLNYTMLISKMTPLAFHNFIRSAAEADDNIPTFYRANTRGQLSKLAKKHGLSVTHVECWPESYMYYSFNKNMFFIMRKISNVVQKVTNNVQLALMCVLHKD
jgi:ubiquinone/menaquinone biosynthesis C-methylase UbiE